MIWPISVPVELAFRGGFFPQDPTGPENSAIFQKQQKWKYWKNNGNFNTKIARLWYWSGGFGTKIGVNNRMTMLRWHLVLWYSKEGT